MRSIARSAALAALFLPTAAYAQGADPAGSGPIVAALAWLQGTLLGNVATAVAVMAVAGARFLGAPGGSSDPLAQDAGPFIRRRSCCSPSASNCAPGGIC